MRLKLFPIFPLLFVFAVPSFGFLLQINQNEQGRIVTAHWPATNVRNGISFWVDAESFPFSEGEVLQIVRDSFDAWEAVESASIGFQDRGTGKFRASTTDRRNVIVYDATGEEVDAPREVGILAFTRINWNERGEIIDADIVFNGGGEGRFSTDQTGSQRGGVDLQGVMTHEIGHFLGLGHTPLQGSLSVRPTMYPFFFGGERSLEPDDRAGVSALYPSPAALNNGAISGQVTHPDGRGAFGVHVVAYTTDTETFVVSALSGAAGDGGGRYKISGLPPGDYQVAIEPLIGSVTSRNFGGIFSRGLDTDFPREFYDNATLQRIAQVIRVSPGRVVDGVDFTLGAAVAGFPYLQDLALPVNTPDPVGPYRVQARVRDDGGVASTELIYRVDAGPFQTLPLGRGSGDLFFVDIPGQPQGSVVEYRLLARDGEGNETSLPAEGLPLLRFEVLNLSGDPVLYVAMRRSRILSVIDTGPGQEVARIPTGGEVPLSVALTPDERYLFVANTGGEVGDNRVSVVETATHRLAATIRVGRAPLDMAISPDGRWVYVTNSRSQSISVIDVGGLREVRKFAVVTAREGPYGIVVSLDGRWLYVTDIEGDRVLILNAKTGVAQKRIDVVASPRSVVVSPGGDRLYVAGFEGGISVVDLEAGEVVGTINTPSAGIFRLALSPDGKRLYATDRLNANLLVVDLDRNLVTSVLPALTRGRETRDLVVSSDGRLIYVANQDSNDLLFFDAASLQIVKSLRIGDGPRGIAVGYRPVARTLEATARADFDGNGQVGFSDFVLFARAFGTAPPDPLFESRFDLDGNGQVDFSDFVLFAGVFGLEQGA